MKHFDDLTQIDCPLGDLDDDTAARLFLRWRNGSVLEVMCHDGEFRDPMVPRKWLPDVTYRLRPEPPRDIDPPWDYLPDWVHFVARDENGQVWGYDVKPEYSTMLWRVTVGNFCEIALNDDRKGNKPWRESLIKRPTL